MIPLSTSLSLPCDFYEPGSNLRPLEMGRLESSPLNQPCRSRLRQFSYFFIDLLAMLNRRTGLNLSPCRTLCLLILSAVTSSCEEGNLSAYWGTLLYLGHAVRLHNPGRARI
ncbi:hypothetical protein BaRGS_00025247 [Batillaria attramentaria]|uniref:Uncharacterized protein n=1 Tax=Batillaria attramentaria TaxID=370345 RepID=A0ABD0K928_9CAEN